MNRRQLILASATLVAVAALFTSSSSQDSSSGMTMSGHDMSRMNHDANDMPGMNGDGGMQAMHSMQGRRMDMGPHMKMTSLRDLKPGDRERADQIVQAARRVGEKYSDYHTALTDGFKIFMPNLPQKMYHFTNYSYALEAAFGFNPDHPTSLLYEKTADGYKLIGVMYTARKDASEDQLDARIPLSIAQWHAHVNLCLPPGGTKDKDVISSDRRFGLAGSISTQDACQAAGGKFIPQVFGWMVHVYPFEQKAADIWSVERQHDHMD